MEEIDYEELEGKEIDYILSNMKVIKAKVINCDPDIGITITSIDGTDYLYCLHGPSSPLWNKRGKPYYREAFENAINSIIRSEELTTESIKNIIKKSGRLTLGRSNLSSATCAFSQ